MQACTSHLGVSVVCWCRKQRQDDDTALAAQYTQLALSQIPKVRYEGVFLQDPRLSPRKVLKLLQPMLYHHQYQPGHRQGGLQWCREGVCVGLTPDARYRSVCGTNWHRFTHSLGFGINLSKLSCCWRSSSLQTSCSLLEAPCFFTTPGLCRPSGWGHQPRYGQSQP